MSSASPNAPGKDTYRLDLGGRIYPVGARQQNAAALVPADQLRNQTIVDEILESLPFAGLRAGQASSRDEIVKAFTNSFDKLQNYKRQVDIMLQAMCQANFQVRQHGRGQVELREKAAQTKLNEMLGNINFAGVPVDRELTAELIEQPVEIIMDRLGASLDNCARGFVRNLFAALDRLIDQQMVGVIQWSGETSCKFHFFKEVLTQKVTSEQVDLLDRPVIEKDFRHSRWLKRQRERRSVMGSHLHSRARHEHHLMNAAAHRVDQCDLVIPEQVQTLLKVIPQWLRPLVHVVDGQRIRQRIIQQDYCSDQWQETKVREIVQLHFDPAVTLDYYVLTGWDCQDIAIEEQRRAEEQLERAGAQLARGRGESAAAAARRLWTSATAAIVLAVAAAMLCLLSPIEPRVFLPLGLMIGLTATVPGVVALRDAAQWRVGTWSIGYLVSATIGMIGTLLGTLLVLIGLLLLSMRMLMLGGILLCVVYPLIALARGLLRRQVRATR